MLSVKSDKSDWFSSQSIVFTKPFKTGMSLGQARREKSTLLAQPWDCAADDLSDYDVTS